MQCHAGGGYSGTSSSSSLSALDGHQDNCDKVHYSRMTLVQVAHNHDDSGVVCCQRLGSLIAQATVSARDGHRLAHIGGKEDTHQMCWQVDC